MVVSSARLAAPALAAALLLSPALRLACDTVCAGPTPAAAAHCEGDAPAAPAHGNEPGRPTPDGCRHADDVVLAKSSSLLVANAVSIPLADLVPSAALVLPAAFGSARDLHRRSPPSAAARRQAILRL